jgi:beta-alanine--pyruvate transaminase
VQAIAQQAAELDYAPPFQMGHPKAFELADKVAKLTPAGLSKSSSPTRAPRRSRRR